ncbi:MAG: hypothetical protein WCC48_15390, partial [Anaeromyxobacteraceae bacterium]
MSAPALAPADFAPLSRGDVVKGPSRPSLSYWKDAWLRLRKNRQALASLGVIVLLVAGTAVGPLLWPVDPGQTAMARISERPRWANELTVLAPPPPYVEVLADG